MPAGPRIAREARTIEAMIQLHCRAQHGTNGALCAGCDELLAYARERLARCPFGEGKTICARCPVHCYKPAMRARVRAVMVEAGPRMLLRHPILTLLHFLDGLRQAPLRPAQAEGRKPRRPAEP